jgi:hypothetical protein
MCWIIRGVMRLEGVGRGEVEEWIEREEMVSRCMATAWTVEGNLRKEVSRERGCQRLEGTGLRRWEHEDTGEGGLQVGERRGQKSGCAVAGTVRRTLLTYALLIRPFPTYNVHSHLHSTTYPA